MPISTLRPGASRENTVFTLAIGRPACSRKQAHALFPIARANRRLEERALWQKSRHTFFIGYGGFLPAKGANHARNFTFFQIPFGRASMRDAQGKFYRQSLLKFPLRGSRHPWRLYSSKFSRRAFTSAARTRTGASFSLASFPSAM